MNVYGSFDPRTGKDDNLLRWSSDTLNKLPGVQVTMLERQSKQQAPTCPLCHAAIENCPSCGGDMRGSEEKGVDTRLATDMIKLAWVDNYDVAVLISSDRDFVPVVEFLSTRGVKTIHGAFPPLGSLLTQSCWGHVNIPPLLQRIRRT